MVYLDLCPSCTEKTKPYRGKSVRINKSTHNRVQRAEEIRKDYRKKMTWAAIAAKHNVSFSTICQVVENKNRAR